MSEFNIPSAAEMIERAKRAGLKEALRLIGLNAAFGSVQLHAYPGYVNAYIDLELSAAGYKTVRLGTAESHLDRLMVSWYPTKP